MLPASPPPTERGLRAITYLAPGLPHALFEEVVAHLSGTLDLPIDLGFECRTSGPMHGDHDPFGSGERDLGFLCSPSYLYLREKRRPAIELVPAAFLFDDPRAGGAPVYFSDVVVRAEHAARSLDDLRGARWGFNDECSLSGYFSTLQELAAHGRGPDFFAEWRRTGSHRASIEETLAGRIDGAAIDSIAWTAMRAERPDLAHRLRVVASFGPFPIQPLVVRRELAPELRRRLTRALLDFVPAPGSPLARLGLRGLVPVGPECYDEERESLRALGMLNAPGPAAASCLAVQPGTWVTLLTGHMGNTRGRPSARQGSSSQPGGGAARSQPPAG